MNTCVICNESLYNGAKTVKLQVGGSETMNKASLSRGLKIVVSPGMEVHESCRRDHTNKKGIEIARKRNADRSSVHESPVKRRSQCQTFDFKRHCCLCGEAVTQRSIFKDKSAFSVRTYDFQTSLVNICHERKDRWATAVLGRIAAVGGDLHAADAVYHQVCSVNFRTGKHPPARFDFKKVKSSSTNPSVGRPKDDKSEHAFRMVVNTLIDDNERQVTVHDLCQEMGQWCETPYSRVYMKKRLQESLGERVTISSIKEKSDVVTFNETAASILQAHREASKNPCDVETAKRQIIQTCTKFILSDIVEKYRECSKEVYPDPSDLKSLDTMLDFLPDSLKYFLDELFVGTNKGLKMASLGQGIVQAARPRAMMAPLQFGLATELHHMYGSKFLIDTLYHHGFCSSYNEVLKFESCAAAQTPTTADIDTECDSPARVLVGEGHFRQFVCDNADRNPWSIDGKISLHAMGMIEVITPSIRRKATIRRDESEARQSEIKILHYETPNKDKPLMYHKLTPISVKNKFSKLDFIWKIARSLKVDAPGWSGVMQAVSTGTHAGKSSVGYLPMIDLNPTNMSCIFSTLSFLAKECSKHNCTPIITFDQPLWFKARTILSNASDDSLIKSVILDLGGFHTMMSYLGSVGHIMTNSGLRELLEIIYGENAVISILNGKAYARAIRGNFLVEAMLTRLLLQETYGAETLRDECNPDLCAVVEMFDRILEQKSKLDVCVESPVVTRIAKTVESTKTELAKYATPSLWLQYMAMVDLLRDFLRSQRTGSWLLQRESLRKMLPYFAASGHNHYTKSIQIYLRDLEELETTNPRIYEMFCAGLFVVRRSDRYWAGLSKDLLIEQTLMRTMKVTGGLVHGRGVMDEKARNKWLLSLPACATVNESMQELTKCNFTTSEQHKELGSARIKRDNTDSEKLFSFLCEHNPFARTDDLRSITSGLTSDVLIVNANKAKMVGEKILSKMYGKDALQFSFCQKDCVVLMGQDKQIRIDGEKIDIDPQLLFQRLIAIGNARTEDDDFDTLLDFELSAQPTAFFDNSGLMREATKSQLLDAIGRIVPDSEQTDINAQFTVFDGGSLIHRIQWKKDCTFDEICERYVALVRRSPAPTVVFDGYNDCPSTKDSAHLRRTKGIVGARISGFSGDKQLTMTKERFLSNAVNKNNFISLLKGHLDEQGIKTAQASGDADCLISECGVDASEIGVTVVVGEDTDLFVILCYLANRIGLSDGCLFLQTEKKNAKRKNWDIGQVCRILGGNTCSLLPFVHAIAGCDTTSRPYGIGKATPLRKVTSDTFKEQAAVFCSAELNTSQTIITEAGEKALVCLYGGKPDENLNHLRLRKFKDKVISGTSAVQVKSLPPTSDAAKYHSLRVYKWQVASTLLDGRRR